MAPSDRDLVASLPSFSRRALVGSSLAATTLKRLVKTVARDDGAE